VLACRSFQALLVPTS